MTLAEAARAAIFELCQVELGRHVVAAKRQESGDAALSENDCRKLRRGAQFDPRNCRLLQPETEDISGDGPDISRRMPIFRRISPGVRPASH